MGTVWMSCKGAKILTQPLSAQFCKADAKERIPGTGKRKKNGPRTEKMPCLGTANSVVQRREQCFSGGLREKAGEGAGSPLTRGLLSLFGCRVRTPFGR